MAVQPTNKSLQQDKDIVVSESKVTGASEPREQLSQVLTNYDEAIQKEIADRIADVDSEEERALIAEAYLAKLIEQERADRIAADGGAGFADAIQAEQDARTQADQRITDSINSQIEPLKIIQSQVSPKAVYVSKSWENRIDPISGSPTGRIVIPNGTTISNFNGANVNFATGANDAGQNFTPINFIGHNNEYARYLIILLADNTLEIRPSSEFSFDPTTAPYPSLATNGILVGSVVVRDNGAGGVGTIADIDQLTITYFKDSLGTGAASAPVINTSPLELQEEELFTYYTKEDFQEEKGALISSTDGISDMANGSQIILNQNKVLFTTDLIGEQARQDALFIDHIQAKLLYKTDHVDNAPLVSISKDGGATYTPASVDMPAAFGNLIVADLTFNPSASPYLSVETLMGVRAVGTHVAAIVSPTHNMLIDSFSMSVRTTATAGTVVGKIYDVYAGTPQSVIRTSSEVLAAGTDITTTTQYKQFSFAPFVMKKGVQYAIVMEGTGLNSSIEVEKTSAVAAYNISSSTKNGGGWVASSDTMCLRIFGSGYEVVMKVQSSMDDTRLAGFGFNYITDSAFMLQGHASWEDRIVTSGEATSGIISLNQISYTPGVRQLRMNRNGSEYFAPQDFLEINPSQIQFPAGFLSTNDKLRFYNTYGLVSTNNGTITFPSIVQQQLVYVTKNGNDTNGDGSVNKPFLTIKAALASITDATPTKRYTVLIAPGSYIEASDFTLKSDIYIYGLGSGSSITIDKTDSSPITTSISTVNSRIALMNVQFTQRVIFNTSAAGIRVESNFIALNGGITVNNTSSEAIVWLRNNVIVGTYVTSGNVKSRIFHSSLFANATQGDATQAASGIFQGAMQFINSTCLGTPLVTELKINGASLFWANSFFEKVTLDKGTVVDDFNNAFFTHDATIPKDSQLTSNITSRRRLGDIKSMGYTPAVNTNWNTVPSEPKSALDELASRIKTAENTTLSAKFNLTAPGSPTPTNDSSQGYSVGSLWVDTTANMIYRATSVSVGAATWELLNSPRNKAIPALDIDWNFAETLYKDVSANTTFTFSNVQAGKSIAVIINNTSAGSITVTFPTNKKDSSFTGTIAAGKETIYTFIRSNGKTYLAEYKDLG